jgi:Protein of unknown function (DUF2934)
MQQELEQQIRERAYQLWMADGCHEGLSDRYWLAAEREVLAAFAASAPKPTTARRANTLSMPAKAPAKPRRRAAAAS